MQILFKSLFSLYLFLSGFSIFSKYKCFRYGFDVRRFMFEVLFNRYAGYGNY